MLAGCSDASISSSSSLSSSSSSLLSDFHRVSLMHCNGVSTKVNVASSPTPTWLFLSPQQSEKRPADRKRLSPRPKMAALSAIIWLDMPNRSNCNGEAQHRLTYFTNNLEVACCFFKHLHKETGRQKKFTQRHNEERRGKERVRGGFATLTMRMNIKHLPDCLIDDNNDNNDTNTQNDDDHDERERERYFFFLLFCF